MMKTAGMKKRKARNRQARLLTPHQAAEVFIRNLTRQVCGDFLDLVEDEGCDPPGRARDYASLKDAVRRQHQLPIHDLDQLSADVLAAVSKAQHASACQALGMYIDAAAEEIIVRENAAYILGLAVGRAFGKRARVRKPF